MHASEHRERACKCELCGKVGYVAEVKFRLPSKAHDFGRPQYACEACRKQRRGEWRYTRR